MGEPFPFDAGFDWVKCKTWKPGATDKQVMVEIKYDGWRVVITKDACFSRGISRVTGERIDLVAKHGRIARVSKVQASLEKGDAVEAELWLPNGEATDVPHALKHSRQRLRAACFGVPFIGGEPIATVREQRDILRWMEKRDLLETTRVWQWMGPLPGSDKHLTDPYLERPNSYWDTYARVNDLEGFIMKEMDADPQRWWKHKPMQTVDLVVTGWTPGEGKFLGLVGSLSCSAYDKDGDLAFVCNCSGMTDDEREEATDYANAGDLTGRVVEVSFQGKGSKIGLRHPQFKRWREDKPAKECVR